MININEIFNIFYSMHVIFILYSLFNFYSVRDNSKTFICFIIKYITLFMKYIIYICSCFNEFTHLKIKSERIYFMK